jgi:crotonobetainyl-CoA:carnitine CoA-transferase CaiB-like acyl-CoA transferase
MDVSIIAAGPWVGALLAELGAEVIKVEPPAGDGTRWQPPQQGGMGAVYQAMNVGKRDMMLDFKDPEGYRLGLELMKTSDVFLHNFRGDAIERLGFGYETLREISPRIVYCAVSGYGEVGPLAKEGSQDFIVQAASGFVRLNGAPGDELEQFRFTGFLDLAGASLGVQGILAALMERERTGLGQKVSVSMLEAALEMQSTRLMEFFATGENPRPMGSETPGVVPDRAFRAQDVDVFVSAQTRSQWMGFCDALDMPELATDVRFALNRDRVRNRAELNAILEPIFATRPALWWMRVLERHGVACGLAHNFEINRYHAQVRENGMMAELDTPWGHVVLGGIPWHFSRTVCEVKQPPVPGEATEPIVNELKKKMGSGPVADMTQKERVPA